MEDSTKNTLIAVGVGVGAVSLIGTAMYFLGGREAPKLPSLKDVGRLARAETGFGAFVLRAVDVGPWKIKSNNLDHTKYWDSENTYHERLNAGYTDDPEVANVKFLYPKRPNAHKWMWSASIPGRDYQTLDHTYGYAETMEEAMQKADEWLADRLI